MIAKAKVISHGSTAVTYSAKKKLVDVIQFHHLPEGISSAAVWSRMMTLQEQFRGKRDRHRPLELTSIRIEVSPAREETVGWTLDDWRKLADDFVRTFDAIDLSEKAKRKSAKSTNVRNSQYVVSLHRDSKSGILHLHINANRIDMDGNVNDAHFLFERARMAANLITEERGWVQAEVKREQNIKKYGGDCVDVLKGMKSFSWEEYEKLLNEKGYSLVFKRDNDNKIRGYTVGRGKVLYKSSDLGHNRGLTPSRIVDTWKQLHQSEIRQEAAPKPATHAPATTDGTQVSRPEPARSSGNPWPSNRNRRRSTLTTPKFWVESVVNGKFLGEYLGDNIIKNLRNLLIFSRLQQFFCGEGENRKRSTTPFVNPCRNAFYCVSLQTGSLTFERFWDIFGIRF